MLDTRFVIEIEVKQANANIEVHVCPDCSGTFGIDSTFVDQVTHEINCPMCDAGIRLGKILENKQS